jgi:hypothetical protein
MTQNKRFKLLISVQHNIIADIQNEYEMMQTNSAREMLRFLGYLIYSRWFQEGKAELRFEDVKKELSLSLVDKGNFKEVRKHLNSCYQEDYKKPMRKRDREREKKRLEMLK